MRANISTSFTLFYLYPGSFQIYVCRKTCGRDFQSLKTTSGRHCSSSNNCTGGARQKVACSIPWVELEKESAPPVVVAAAAATATVARRKRGKARELPPTGLAQVLWWKKVFLLRAPRVETACHHLHVTALSA